MCLGLEGYLNSTVSDPDSHLDALAKSIISSSTPDSDSSTPTYYDSKWHARTGNTLPDGSRRLETSRDAPESKRKAAEDVASVSTRRGKPHEST